MPSVRLLVPEPVADALRGEANRRLMRPGEVLTDFLRTCWPHYAAGELARDLRPILDAEIVDVSSDAETASGLPEAAPRPISADQVAPSLPPGDPERGPDGGTD
jgi:hypothetical protein